MSTLQSSALSGMEVEEHPQIIISDEDYRWNLLRMMAMWSAASFSGYLMMFLNKYLQGSIFLNFYLTGCSGITGAALASYVYDWLRLRNSFLFSFGLTLGAGCLIFLFEAGVFSPKIVYYIGLSRLSPGALGTAEESQFYMGKLIPFLGFVTNVGINCTW